MDRVDEDGTVIMPDDDDPYPHVMNDEQDNNSMEEPTLSFWHLDETDIIVCRALFLLLVALAVILVLATT